MSRVARNLVDMPVVARCALIGALVAGIPGAAVGLAIGIVVYPPTAWFALFEIGLPAAMLGAALGFLFGMAELGASKLRQRKP